MKKTKEKILSTALELFNKNGLAQVTLRTIASEMGISQGNLNYHYKKREDIIEALYHKLVHQIDGNMVYDSNNGLDFLMKSTKATLSSFFDYRFFMLDFAQIMRAHKKIRTHYKTLSKQREKQILGLIQLLINEGLIRPAKLKDEYVNFYKRTRIIADFWMTSLETESSPITKKSMSQYAAIIIQSLYPYLTKKGVKIYDQLTSDAY